MNNLTVTDEQRTIIQSVWRQMQGDANLLDAVLAGEFDDFCAAVIELVGENEQIRRQIPVGLMLRMLTPQQDFVGLVEMMKEFLRFPFIDRTLDVISGISPDD